MNQEKTYFPIAEEIVDAQCAITQVDDRGFFRNLVSFTFWQLASMMRATIYTQSFGTHIPINGYVINLAIQGYSKNKSLGIINDKVTHLFTKRFLEETLPIIVDDTLNKIAMNEAIKNNTDQQEELDKLQKEYKSYGEFLSSFDSGSKPAFKQYRAKMLLVPIGSLNLIMDEIGSNLSGNNELLTAFLEAYDTGEIREKLKMNTKDNQRTKERKGRVPCNLLAFGEPTKLLDGNKVEEEFDTLLGTGFARRCIFGFGKTNIKPKDLSAKELFEYLKDPKHSTSLYNISQKLEILANPLNYNKKILIDEEAEILLHQYKLDCENLSFTLGEHETLKKRELEHRYWKTLKLAGAYAFVDSSYQISIKHIQQAISLVEDSGEAFEKILTRERPYVRLAKYLSSINSEVTQVDLIEAGVLKGTESQKRELITLATAYGYKNNIIIKRFSIDGIDFLLGESLKETNLDSIILSYSTQLAEGYKPRFTEWNKLYKGFQADNIHWCNHHFVEDYRLEKNAIPGFNIIVLDIDGSVSLNLVHILLKDYTFLTYTTKRHSEETHRFRLILPISHEVKLNDKDFSEFMKNVCNWLPFEVDNTHQRSKKWLSNKGTHYYNDGEILDALQFIPKTSKADENKKKYVDSSSLSNLERWFSNQMEEGNRNNVLIKYALLLVDMNLDEDTIQSKIIGFNNKLSNPLDELEIQTTIMKTVIKAIAKRGN
jgi:hypothetical protein